MSNCHRASSKGADDCRFPGRLETQLQETLEAEAQWKIEHILSHHGAKEQAVFKVKWTTGDVTWLPYDQIIGLGCLKEYLELLGVETIEQLPSGSAVVPPGIEHEGVSISLISFEFEQDTELVYNSELTPPFPITQSATSPSSLFTNRPPSPCHTSIMPPQCNGKSSGHLHTPAHSRPLLQLQPPPVKVSNWYVLRKGVEEFHVHEVPGSNSLGGLIGHLPSILMLQYVEHNDYLRRLHKKKGIAACCDYRHEPIGYPTVVASYNLGSMKTKFVEWVNTNGQYKLTHLDSPSPSAKELRVDMPILFNPSTLEILGYVLVPK
ncbi:hypothetical protein IW261DRAFT_1568230 [Armillaria novae-zelandiae]|uniref:Chromo domain-containing protein n=1 Tax=Armillaria novae-zelandiae TaxID=153914 RepID=A0AA39T9U4_9AGAR|nr:hypothetical protein IW261DRAFT_1568230 [Armillaria novae-zelandiae]